MHIQWFPGHMTKSIRMMQENIKLVDIVIYILDSRVPFSCLNPKFDQLIQNKKVIYVLNKSDLANQMETKKWISFFKSNGKNALALSSIKTNSSAVLKNEILKVMSETIEKNRNKGVYKAIRAMIIGVPNVGKSTLINNFVGKAHTITGDKPGVTRAKQWVKLQSGIELLDTPGTLCPAFENQKIARHLAYIFSIREEIVDVSELALEFLKEFAVEFPSELKARYNLDALSDNALENMEAIARKRGAIVKGGECDYEKISKIIFDDFRKGRLGNITLEKAGESVVEWLNYGRT